SNRRYIVIGTTFYLRSFPTRRSSDLVTIFVILVVWFLLPRVARLMIHTPTAISIFVCLSMVQLMAVFISMRCTLCGHFLQVALTQKVHRMEMKTAKIGRAVQQECRDR